MKLLLTFVDAAAIALIMAKTNNELPTDIGENYPLPFNEAIADCVAARKENEHYIDYVNTTSDDFRSLRHNLRRLERCQPDAYARVMSWAPEYITNQEHEMFLRIGSGVIRATPGAATIIIDSRSELYSGIELVATIPVPPHTPSTSAVSVVNGDNNTVVVVQKNSANVRIGD